MLNLWTLRQYMIEGNLRKIDAYQPGVSCSPLYPGHEAIYTLLPPRWLSLCVTDHGCNAVPVPASVPVSSTGGTSASFISAAAPSSKPQ